MNYIKYLFKNVKAISEAGILIKPPRTKLLILYMFFMFALFVLSLFSFAVFWFATIILFVFWFVAYRTFLKVWTSFRYSPIPICILAGIIVLFTFWFGSDIRMFFWNLFYNLYTGISIGH